MKRLLVLAMFVATPAWAADTAFDPRDVAARADAYMQARLKVSKHFNGTVLIARDGKPLFERGYGYANFEYDIPNTPWTKFRLASVSKQFVATGIMLLEHDGKLKVEDKLSQHLPDCPKSWGDVTLRQLLSHTSGVPENLRPALFKSQWPVPVTLDHILDIVKDRPLDFKPGEKFSYSNTGYVLLGLIIERITDRPYGDFLRERIFEPLGMTDTGVDDRKLVLKGRACNYSLVKDQPTHAQYFDMSQAYAAGSLYSTVEDLLKWDNALYTDAILPQKSLERMWTPVKDGYGYGWLSLNRLGRKLIWHNGGLPGCSTMVLRYPEQKVYVAVLSNLDAGLLGTTPTARVAYDLAAIGLGDSYDIPVVRKEVKVDPKLYDLYEGDYELGPKRTVTISKRDDSLYLQVTGQGKIQIYPESPTQFFAKAAELTIAFVKSDKGEVNELVLHDNGRDTKAKRVAKKAEPKAGDKPKEPAKAGDKPKEPAKAGDKPAEKIAEPARVKDKPNK